MVRLTQVLCKYTPDWYHLQKSGSSYFRNQALFNLTRYTPRLGWNVKKAALSRFHYMLKKEWFLASEQRQRKRDINSCRIAAACEEHDMQPDILFSTLPKLDVHLTSAALATLAIYEPQTFRSLVDICREASRDPPQPGNFNQKLL